MGTRRRRLLCLALIAGLASTALIAERSLRPGHARDLVSRVGGALGLGGRSVLPEGAVTVVVDPGRDVHPISPYIYGVAVVGEGDYVDGLRAALNRWGGNGSSRFNWVIGHASNAAADYAFRNRTFGTPGSAPDDFVASNRSHGVASLITIPALGWVAKSDLGSDASVDVPADGGPASGPDGRIAGYDPTANRARTSVPSLARKPAPFVVDPDSDRPAVYQDEWVHHLVTRFGRADQGGVRFYAVDNEPELWSVTHRDVHPARMGYDDLARVMEEYSSAIKAVDPSAAVLGPESWGWTGYLYSGLDRGDDNFETHADRTAHGDMPFIPWWLRTLRRHDAATGGRSVDVLTVHYYPQAPGVFGDRSSPETDALRLRSTRSLWDPTYVDESWIGEPVRLIPRLREWAREYPGTRLGLTEYNFGGGGSISGGLAEADALGIFGREGLYLATYWIAPPPQSPAWFAFHMYRDYDGRGGHFAETSIRATSSSPETVSSFAGRERGWIDIMLVNNDLSSARAATVRLDRAESAAGAGAQRYQYSIAAQHAIVRRPDLAVDGGMVRVELPAASMTLLRVPVRG